MNKIDDFSSIAEKYHISPVIARLIRNREIVGDEQIQKYLNATLEDLYDAHLLKDADKAANIIIKKIREHKKIRLITDYDIDGVESSYIGKKVLRDLGADFDCVIPHRIENGYGISIDLIEKAIADDVDTIITCDNGIAAIEQIAYAKEHGLTVIVTDHHEVPYEEVNGQKQYKYVNADAIVNPKQEECNYPFKGLCGATVIWKVAQILYEKEGYPKEKAFEMIENVAFATIGDVMELVDENRILVRYGLEKMQNSSNVGFRALVKACGLEDTKIASYHIGFVLGPCINASGRLETAIKALELLEETDEVVAEARAKEIVELNTERKAMTEEGVSEAEAYIEEHQLSDKPILVIYLPQLHESLNGIVAGRIKELYHKPTFVLSNGENCIKGSGRSISAYSMYEELVKVLNCMLGFGGHPLAAGLSIENEEKVTEFYENLLKNCQLTEEDLKQSIYIDMALPFQYIYADLIKQLDVLEPFGNGNKKPLFGAKHLRICSLKLIGADKKSAKLTLMNDESVKMTALLFKKADDLVQAILEKGGESMLEGLFIGKNTDVFMDIIFYPSINEFRGVEELQVIISDFRIQ